MIFDHKVNHNGILYMPGQDVPIEKKSDPKKEDVVEKKTASSSHLFDIAEQTAPQDVEEKPKRRGRKPRE